MSKKIILVTSGSLSSVALYNALSKEFRIDSVIVEESIKPLKLIRGRIKRIGLLKVVNQLIFQVLVPRTLRLFSKNRIQELKTLFSLEYDQFPLSKVSYVDSINSKTTLTLLREIGADLVIVNGTRIISRKILDGCNSTFINTHLGLTPRYRGVHGGYWALANNDQKNVGVTIHFVDKGIDTGGVIYQARVVTINNRDNFVTYPYHQLALGIVLMKKAVHDFLSDNLVSQEPLVNDSKLWYHPTFTDYLYNYFTKGIL